MGEDLDIAETPHSHTPPIQRVDLIQKLVEPHRGKPAQEDPNAGTPLRR